VKRRGREGEMLKRRDEEMQGKKWKEVGRNGEVSNPTLPSNGGVGVGN
jgi:hypothetical protein